MLNELIVKLDLKLNALSKHCMFLFYSKVLYSTFKINNIRFDMYFNL